MKIFGKSGKATDQDLGDARKTFDWPDGQKADNLLWRLPRNVQWNDNVVVKEDEFAVFFRDGKALHVFDRPGRFVLTTENVPVLGTLGAKLTGVRQLGEIYYLQRRELRGKFGTKEPLSFRDPDFGVVRIRVFGQFAYKVDDPMMLITQFIGSKGYGGSDEVISWVKDQIVMILNDVMGELKRDQNMGVLDMPAYLQELEQMCLSRLTSETERYGLVVTKFSGLNINLPDEVQAAIDKRGAMSALGVDYMQYQTGKAVEGIGEGAAKGGDASGFAGMGAGMGAGYAMGQSMNQGMQPTQSSKQPIGSKAKCPKCGQPYDHSDKFCPNCGALLDKGGEDKIKCPNCGHLVEKGVKFCPNCGASMTLKCPECDAELQPGTKFCPNCGNKF